MVSFVDEFNYISTIPLNILLVIVIFFFILTHNLSLLNIIIFIGIYVVLTRIYVEDDDLNKLQNQDNQNDMDNE